MVASNENNTGVLTIYLPVNLWRYGWPPLCMMGLVGNTPVLLVLRRDGLVRTSANVYLSALAVGDSLVLMFATLAAYPGFAWSWWLQNTSLVACHTVWLINHTLVDASTWLIVAFTVERCVVVRFPLLKLHLCTPRNAGLCCLSLLALAFGKNIDISFIYRFTKNDPSFTCCQIPLVYYDYVFNYRRWITLVFSCLIPMCILLVCNWIITRTLRWELKSMAAGDSVTRATVMCLGVSIAYIICILPMFVFNIIYKYYAVAPLTRAVLGRITVFLRYANRAINFFLCSLTGAHFRRELVALCRRCVQRACAAVKVVRN